MPQSVVLRISFSETGISVMAVVTLVLGLAIVYELDEGGSGSGTM
jgi:hypothetical protein